MKKVILLLIVLCFVGGGCSTSKVGKVVLTGIDVGLGVWSGGPVNVFDDGSQRYPECKEEESLGDQQKCIDAIIQKERKRR